MFFTVSKKLKNGSFIFHNGQRRMSVDEVKRRVPIEWIEDIDKEAAEYVKSHSKEEYRG